jgi:hypothetical protein
MRRPRGQDRRVVRGVACSALVTLAALAAAGHASAATYHAYLCKVPSGPNAGSPAPTEAAGFTSNAAATAATDSCATGGAMTAALDGAATHGYGDGAAVIYDAPGNLTIAGFRAWRHEAVAPQAGTATPFTNIGYTGAASAEGGPCQQSGGCLGRGNPSSPFAPENEVAAANLSGVTQIRFDAFCGGVPGSTCPATGAGTRSAEIDVFAADILLADGTAPAVSGASGPLLAGAPLTGAQSVSFKATDAGSGVHRGSLVVDGQVATDTVLDAAGGACADLGVAADGRPSFLNTQPCPPAVNGVLTLNTDLLAPGTHDLTVRVADAAGNQSTGGTVKITTIGARPAGTGNGTGASRFAKLTARFAGARRSVRRLGFATRPSITGRLVDENKRPIVGAAVELLVRNRVAGARSAPVATATTGTDGSFRVQAPSGPSRTITVRYTAFAGDPKPAATVALRALVRARVSVSVSSRSPRAGRPVRLSGRIRYLPRSGVVVFIQAREGRTWRNIDSVETRSRGTYSWPYRFSPRQAGRTYFFRARVKSTNYPFAPGTSATIAVSPRR